MTGSPVPDGHGVPAGVDRPADTYQANDQRAFGFYARDPQTGGYYTVGLMVLTFSGTQICAMTRFDASTLPRFGLPLTLS